MLNSPLSKVKTPVTGTKPSDLLARITSQMPTRYRLVECGGSASIYVYCALDTLEYALVAGGIFDVFSDSPAGPAIRFSLTSTGPEPIAGWMSTVICGQIAQLPAVEDLPSRCCPYTHFFASKEAHVSWNSTLPDEVRSHIDCISLSEAWQRAQEALAACQVPFSCKCQ